MQGPTPFLSVFTSDIKDTQEDQWSLENGFPKHQAIGTTPSEA